jgi:hypothetical protein
MKINQTNIRRAAVRYKMWLENQQWFSLNINDKEEWLEPIVKIINKTACSPAFLWECIIDHWQCTNWSEGHLPDAFQYLYDLVEEYRTTHGVDGTDNINLLIDELKKPQNQSLKPNFVISRFYEKLSGKMLLRETDENNGEDYDYKSGDGVCMTSYGLHQEVSDFFGFESKYLHVGNKSLLAINLKNWEIGSALRTYAATA